MRILFVWTAAEFSTMDVARGYRQALERQGHEIRDYRLSRRMLYHAKALGEKRAQDVELLSKMASENVILEAIKHQADLVVIISALNFHPDGIWFLARCSWPTAVIFTESPYSDQQQLDNFASVYPEMLCCTNERISARRYDWLYLPPSYDQNTHRPGEFDQDEAVDVIMIGTGWKERAELLEAVDWTGIKLRLMGFWTNVGLSADSPLVKYLDERVVHNPDVPRYYASTKICLNFHRADSEAESWGPRIVETAACGAFQLSDDRRELREKFGWSIPTFRDAAELEHLIRFYLANDELRKTNARRARELVQGETFDARATTLMDAVARRSTKVAV